MVRGWDDREANGQQLGHVEVALLQDVVAKICLLVDDKSVSKRVPVGGVEHLATRREHDVALLSQIESNVLAEVFDLGPLRQLNELAPVVGAELGHGGHVVEDHDLLLEYVPTGAMHRSTIFILADLIRFARKISWRFFLCIGAAHI